MISPNTVQFLYDIKDNNNRDWFEANKDKYLAAKDNVVAFIEQVKQELEKNDIIEKYHLYRIYRDVRFSKDKTPYKTYFSGYFARAGADRRGGYYFSIEPGKSQIGGGFYGPEKHDLLRIRKEFERDTDTINNIIAAPKFVETFGELKGEGVKTAPKGFSKDHPNIHLIRKKHFYAMKTFTDEQVLAPDFIAQIIDTYSAIRPFFDYMSDVLTTNLDGERIV